MFWHGMGVGGEGRIIGREEGRREVGIGRGWGEGWWVGFWGGEGRRAVLGRALGEQEGGRGRSLF